MAAPKPGGRGPLAVILVVVLLVVLGGGYAVGGYLYGNGKVNSAIDTYNTVVDHENKLTDTFNKLDAQFDKNNLATDSIDALKQEKTLYQQLVTESLSSQATVASDDQALAGAEASLKENSWLTALSKSSIDKWTNKIDHARAALAIAKTILADYIQYGKFHESVDDMAVDYITMSKDVNNSDIRGAITANTALKADLAAAISLDKAPGVASQYPGFLTDVQAVSKDFSDLIAAAQAGNNAGIDAAGNAYDSDTSKLDKYDFTSMATEEQNFYKQLIESYNAEIDKANAA